MGTLRRVKSDVQELTVAICGNPNSGKTTVFNAVTGLHQKVGNYPGVTVEKKSGAFRVRGSDRRFVLLDIPGSYSLSAFSPDEYIAARALWGDLDRDHRPDIIVCVIDATNLDRGLYLLFQVMQIGVPVVVALNMVDLAAHSGIIIDRLHLSRLLGGVPVISIIASRGRGIARLKALISSMADRPVYPTVKVYDSFTEEVVTELTDTIGSSHYTRAEYYRILFDKSGPAEDMFLKREGHEKIEVLEQCRKKLTDHFGLLSTGETGSLMRRGVEFAEQVRRTKGKRRKTSREKIDRILLHPLLGPLILAVVMVMVFQSVFTWAAPAMDMINSAFEYLTAQVSGVMQAGPLRSLIVNGVIGGVGSVLVFLPQIVILFFFIAILEDSGYMPRAAFLVDRLFSWCGLSGRSFIPLLASFACAVPGIMATRTIENRKLRMITIMVAPLMSCSARLPVYTIMIAAFIPLHSYLGIFNSRGLVLAGLYFLGLIAAILVSLILNKTVYKTERGTFMMEMPPYTLPTMRSVLIRLYNRVKAFLLRAGTIILAITILIWAFSYYPHSADITNHFDDLKSVRTTQFSEETSRLDQDLAAVRGDLHSMDREVFAVLLADVQTEEEIPLTSQELLNAYPEAGRVIDLTAGLRVLEIRYASDMARLVREEAGAYLRESYFGRMGRIVAPLFEPLGWDWKISMATLASFPAREVIIATLGTIYNLGTDGDESSSSLVAKLQQATWEEGSKAGKPVFTPAVAMSIMVFFALCAQCGATLVTIKHETASWLMAVIAFVYMTALAYVSAFAAYQVLSRMGW